MSGEFKYDVAFSFLAEDEATAGRLNDILKGRLTTFLYSERQKELAGTDGELTFKRVFESEARVAVVLYRAGWGDVRWTAVEKAGIRARAFNHRYGYRFVFFIRMDSASAPLPEWFPEQAIWFDLQRWGLEGAAAAIEQRVQEFGGEPREETAIDRAARMQADMLVENERNLFIDSPEGAKAVLDGLRQIFEQLKVISESQNLIGEPKITRFALELPSKFHHWTITLNREHGADNTAKGAELIVREWHGSVLELGIGLEGLPQPRNTTTFALDYRDGTRGWRQKPKGSQFYRHEKLADWIADRLLTRIEEERKSYD